MITIGVTGHRPNRLKVSEKKLAARVRSILKALIKAAPRSDASGTSPLNIVSPLAEGTDRIVAREALALGQKLTAVTPFATREYEKTFSSPEAAVEFRALWKASAERVNLKGIAKRPEAAYVAVGNVTLTRCDIVLTIWDGKPAAGRGGTPEILQNALEWGIPIVWVNATKDIDIRVLVSTSRGGELSVLARRRGRLSFNDWMGSTVGM